MNGPYFFQGSYIYLFPYSNLFDFSNILFGFNKLLIFILYYYNSHDHNSSLEFTLYIRNQLL